MPAPFLRGPAVRSTTVVARSVAVASSFVLALGAAGCTELGEPDYGIGSPTTTAGAGTEVATAEAGTSTTLVAPSTGEVFVPPRPDGYVPELLVASDQGLLVADTEAATVDRLAEPLGSLVAQRVVGDYFGGLLAEDTAGTIEWYRDPAAEASLVVEEGTLLDVGFLDDRFEVQVFLGGAGAGADIERIRLADGERAVFATLGPSERLVDFAASDGVQVAAVADEACGRLLFFDAVGDRVDLGSFAEPECPVPGRLHFGSVSLDVDSVVAYTERTYRSDGLVASTDVVLRRLGAEIEDFRLPVGGPGDAITSLTFDGVRVAFVRTPATGAPIVVLIDPAEVDAAAGIVETVVELPLLDDPSAVPNPLAVAFARQPLVIGRTS